MKKFVLSFVVTLAIGGLYGCSSAPPKPDAPLQTGGETAPPPGCQDLRLRGGAC